MVNLCIHRVTADPILALEMLQIQSQLQRHCFQFRGYRDLVNLQQDLGDIRCHSYDRKREAWVFEV